MPGTGSPIVPGFGVGAAEFVVATGEVSVSPYPSAIVTPVCSRKRSRMLTGRAAAPDAAVRRFGKRDHSSPGTPTHAMYIGGAP
jgi:hypothetical protein